MCPIHLFTQSNQPEIKPSVFDGERDTDDKDRYSRYAGRERERERMSGRRKGGTKLEEKENGSRLFVYYIILYVVARRGYGFKGNRSGFFKTGSINDGVRCCRASSS
jgi:hypothetical protein